MSEEMLSEGVRYPHYPQALLDINGGEGKKKKKKCHVISDPAGSVYARPRVNVTAHSAKWRTVTHCWID